MKALFVLVLSALSVSAHASTILSCSGGPFYDVDRVEITSDTDRQAAVNGVCTLVTYDSRGVETYSEKRVCSEFEELLVPAAGDLDNLLVKTGENRPGVISLPESGFIRSLVMTADSSFSIFYRDECDGYSRQKALKCAFDPSIF